MAQRFRRKELKQDDEFVSTATRATQWLMQRRRRIGWILLGVVVVVSIVAGVRVYQDRRDERAAGMLAAAMEIYRAPVVAEEEEAAPDEGTAETAAPATEDGPSAESAAATDTSGETGTPTAAGDEHAAAGHLHFTEATDKYAAARDAFSEIVETYPRTASGRVAAYYLGICHAELGDTEAASAALEQATQASERLIASMARFRLGQLYLAAGDPESAIRAFEELVERGDGIFPRPAALIGKARAHLAAGDDRAALAAYQEVVDEYGDSFAAVDARQRVEELAARLGLDPTVES